MRADYDLHAENEEVEDNIQYRQNNDAAGHDRGYRGNAEKQDKLHRIYAQPCAYRLECERGVHIGAEGEQEGQQRDDDV